MVTINFTGRAGQAIKKAGPIVLNRVFSSKNLTADGNKWVYSMPGSVKSDGIYVKIQVPVYLNKQHTIQKNLILKSKESMIQGGNLILNFNMGNGGFKYFSIVNKNDFKGPNLEPHLPCNFGAKCSYPGGYGFYLWEPNGFVCVACA